MQITHTEENLRLVDTGLSKFKIVLDRQQGLWHFETEQGPLPVPLREQFFTSYKHALVLLKNYVDNFKERQVVYKKEKV